MNTFLRMSLLSRVALFLALLFWAAASTGQPRSEPVGVGDMAPDFTLADQNGVQRSLAGERGKRPVVLIFYRGHW